MDIDKYCYKLIESKTGSGAYFYVDYYEEQENIPELRLMGECDEISFAIQLCFVREVFAKSGVYGIRILQNDGIYDNVIKRCGFSYERTDFIFEYDESGAIIKDEELSEKEKLIRLSHASCIVSEGAGRVFISEVYVEPSHRGRGEAKKLMEHIKERYAGSGKKLMLHTDSDNPAAVALYQSTGFFVAEERYSYLLSYE